MSDRSVKVSVLRPLVSVWSGGVGLVCGMKRGIDGTVWQWVVVNDCPRATSEAHIVSKHAT
jgi:hypothetical protein